jgi:hypothetical protein
MVVLYSWGATDVNQALAKAARRGALGAMRLAHEWGATNYARAAQGATKEALKLLAEWV